MSYQTRRHYLWVIQQFQYFPAERSVSIPIDSRIQCRRKIHGEVRTPPDGPCGSGLPISEVVTDTGASLVRLQGDIPLRPSDRSATLRHKDR